MITKNIDQGRRRFLTTAATVVGGVGAVAAAVPFVSNMNPSAKTKAIGAPVEVDISKLEPGDRMIQKWQGKPVWILRRTGEMLKDISSLNDKVSDPASDDSAQPDYAKNEFRAREDEFLVVIGICTHLGCSPSFVMKGEGDSIAADWKGGFFCPCHGSKFDLVGRVYSGVPAPTNLSVPPHYYESENVLIIGEDEEVT